MRVLCFAAVALVAAGCASTLPQLDSAKDPSNPDAPESVASAPDSGLGAAAFVPTAIDAGAPPMHHHHGMEGMPGMSAPDGADGGAP